MNRREAVLHVSMIFGGTLIGTEAFLSGCSPTGSKKEGLFSEDDLALLDDISDTIIPATPGSGGAKIAKVADFMKKIVRDCYTPEDQQVFTEGIVKFKAACDQAYKKPFSKLVLDERESFLEKLDKTAKAHEQAKQPSTPSHYYTMMKQLTVWGYFSSKEGATKALRYVANPGRYEGIVDYKKGDKAWATK